MNIRTLAAAVLIAVPVGFAAAPAVSAAPLAPAVTAVCAPAHHGQDDNHSHHKQHHQMCMHAQPGTHLRTNFDLEFDRNG